MPLPEPSSGTLKDAQSAEASLESFALGLDGTGGACRIVQPLTPTELRHQLDLLNTSLLHVPKQYFCLLYTSPSPRDRG